MLLIAHKLKSRGRKAFFKEIDKSNNKIISHRIYIEKVQQHTRTMSSTSPSTTELGDFLSPLRPSSPFFDKNFRAGLHGSTGFSFGPSPADQDNMPSLGLPSVPIANTTNAEIGQAPTCAAHPPAVYAQAQDWDNDGISTLSVDDTNATRTYLNQRPATVKNNAHSATSTASASTTNNVFPSAFSASKKHSPEFQYILYGILKSGRHDDILSWHDGGKSVLVTDIDRFTNEILRDYYGHGQRPLKFLSFKRQLHRYGFHAETRLSDKNTKTFYFRSEKFQKDRLDLLNTMISQNQKKR